MHSLTSHSLSAEQIDELDALAESATAPVRVLLEAVARSLRHGEVIVALDAARSLTPREVAECLGVSRTHVYALLDRGALASYRVGRDRRIRLTDVFDFDARRDAARRELVEVFDRHMEREAALVEEIAETLPD